MFRLQRSAIDAIDDYFIAVAAPEAEAVMKPKHAPAAHLTGKVDPVDVFSRSCYIIIPYPNTKI